MVMANHTPFTLLQPIEFKKMHTRSIGIWVIHSIKPSLLSGCEEIHICLRDSFYFDKTIGPMYLLSSEMYSFKYRGGSYFKKKAIISTDVALCAQSYIHS